MSAKKDPAVSDFCLKAELLQAQSSFDMMIDDLLPFAHEPPPGQQQLAAASPLQSLELEAVDELDKYFADDASGGDAAANAAQNEAVSRSSEPTNEQKQQQQQAQAHTQSPSSMQQTQQASRQQPVSAQEVLQGGSGGLPAGPQFGGGGGGPPAGKCRALAR
ncbi:hypothetical protein PLESTB_001028500 [Pleodorina starrii]|uniref:Uncharacterized protein n=1 Tax=Pleodorina starrii TaxID=330485 RepID=A0A9W6F4S1_9CHLO|nr:hypothetical protein PLESTB_001028500 [Pleodorina starrii]GLC68859.1 hypothetical protein PLESTF_000746200 [Pleodorina starrii]